MNRRLSVFVTACLMTTTPAFAADMKHHYDVPLTPQHVGGMDWDGFYAGFNMGYGVADEIDTASTGGITRLSPQGGHFGVQAGYNFQHEQMVFGAELGVSQTGMTDTVVCPNPAFTCKGNIDTIATLQARIGYAHENLLFFATGGVAYGFGGADTDPVFPGISYETFGYTVGAGLEVGITDQLSGKIEYSYIDFNAVNAPAGTIDNVATSIDTTAHLVKVGLNYHF